MNSDGSRLPDLRIPADSQYSTPSPADVRNVLVVRTAMRIHV